MRLFRNLSAKVSLGLILEDRKDGDVGAQRRRIDRFLERHAEDYPFMLAYDAALMFAEERHDEAMNRLSDCLAALPADNSPESEYVSLYCEAFNLLPDLAKWKEVRQKALSLEVDPLVRTFLNFSEPEAVAEIIDRQPQDAPSSPEIARRDVAVHFKL